MVAKGKFVLDVFKKVIPAIDNKDYDLYDSLSEVERKAFASVVIMRWGVNITSDDKELHHYYLASMNYHANKHLYSMYKHPKLQWLMIVAGSPKFGHYKRKWIGKKASSDKARNLRKSLLRVMYPTYKDDDIDVLSTMVTKRELTQYKKDSGN